jgi:mannose-binding lectin 1
LNDGNTEYKHHMSVDSLAFGHCAYHYRNLGRTSKLQIQHSRTKFEVKVDGNTCFSTDKVCFARDLPPSKRCRG